VLPPGPATHKQYQTKSNDNNHFEKERKTTVFTIHEIRTHEQRNNPMGTTIIDDNATLAEAIRRVQDGIRKTDNAYQIFDNYSGEQYSLAELYEIQALAKTGT
jgi:hypothetical protein